MGNFEKTLFVFALFFYSCGFFLSSLPRHFFRTPFLTLRASAPAITYLPGVLDLRGVSPSILGVEAKVDPKEVVKYVNGEREKVGAPALRISPTLERAAQMRAEVMVRYQNLSHQDPFERIQLDTVLPMVDYYFSYASENIALAQGNSAGFVAGWMNSPSHKQNILDANLVETGVGVANGKFGDEVMTVAVQIFAIPTPVERYRGYSDSDIKGVSDSLLELERELSRVNSYLDTGVGNREYYWEWKRILERQKEILSTVLTYMRTGQAFKKEHYDLINEYNRNWSLVPK